MRHHATLENEIRWPRRVLTLAEAVKFIDATGYCMLFPVKNVPLPSLYYAVTRRGLHGKWKWDKYSSMVWRWKDELPRRRRAFYAKYFRGRGTFISLKLLPHFLALRESAVGPGDYEQYYSEGRIRDDARIIWEALEEHGPLATLELRNACKMDTKAGNIRFKRAILDLQRMLIVVHFGAEQEVECVGLWPLRIDVPCVPATDAGRSTHFAGRCARDTGREILRMACEFAAHATRAPVRLDES